MKRAAKVHLSLTVVWALLLIPTLLWWNQAVMWIALMSLYANDFVGHLSCYQAARAEGAANSE